MERVDRDWVRGIQRIEYIGDQDPLGQLNKGHRAHQYCSQKTLKDGWNDKLQEQ